MTWPAALSGAAVRVLRTAAGRRALHLVLLVGGLFVLGFLCGGQAHAAEGTTPVVAATSTASTASTVSTAAKDVVQSVPGHVARPVGDLVGTVTQDLGEARAKAPSLPKLPVLPKPPAKPSLPAPVTEAPRPQQPGGPSVSSPPETASGAHAGTRSRTDSRTEPRTRTAVAHGPGLTPGVTAPAARTHADGHRTAVPVGVPSHPAPTGDPDGALSNRAAVDNGTSRHVDAHAVTPDHRAPLRLVPGATARLDAPGTRDRHRDVPVFPG
ncbi:hypothetical protein [Streptomyces sp. NPDC051636]|uniref:hypothetical protein n=1 Tax=Streptomyces sp. NPDC051636 TaxID=3365663 RepID=UPI0037AD8B48